MMIDGLVSGKAESRIVIIDVIYLKIYSTASGLRLKQGPKFNTATDQNGCSLGHLHDGRACG
jgi:hypothetical protein